MSAHDAAATFARGLAVGLFWAAITVLTVLVITALIFWAQGLRARRSLPRERRGALPVSPPTEGPRPSGRRAGPTGAREGIDVLTLESDVPTGVHLIDWRAQRRRERERAR